MVPNHFTQAVAENRQAASRAASVAGSIGSFPGPAAVDPRIKRVEVLIHRAIQRKLPLRELAVSTGLSVSRLCHLFHNQTGMSPGRYLKAARLAKARELLETSTLSIKEVAARAGFNHVGRFIGTFRKAYGLTPSQHRRAVLRSELSTEN